MHLKYCDAHTASWTSTAVEARSKRYRASRTCLSVFLRVIARRTSSHFCHSINATCMYIWSYVYAFFDVLLADSSRRLRCSEFGALLIGIMTTAPSIAHYCDLFARVRSAVRANEIGPCGNAAFVFIQMSRLYFGGIHWCLLPFAEGLISPRVGSPHCRKQLDGTTVSETAEMTARCSSELERNHDAM
jgi:hypothetical protein